MSIGYNFYRATLAGIAPLILHNGRLSNPLDDYAKAIGAITGKRKKTEADHEKIAQLEWRGGLYTDGNGNLIIPGRVLEALVHSGAKVSKEGKQALSGIFVESDGTLDYKGRGKSIDEMMEDPFFRITVPVRVKANKVQRTRVILHDWTVTFDVSASTDVIRNGDVLKKWLQDAGSFSGLCEWRPRYGRFVVTKFEQLKMPVVKAA